MSNEVNDNYNSDSDNSDTDMQNNSDSDDNDIDMQYVGGGDFKVSEEEADDFKASEEEDDDFKVIPSKDVVKYMTDIVDECMNIIPVSRSITLMLLNNFKWNTEKLFEKYFNSTQEEFLKNVTNPEECTLKLIQKTLQGITEDCEICYTSYPCNSEELKGLECNHKYCTNCWNQYLKSKIMDEGLGLSINCPTNGCNLLIDYINVMKLLTDQQVKVTYEKLITNNFVESKKNLRWCPAINCTFAIEVPCYGEHEIKCNCGHLFCFKCGNTTHKPVSCELLEQWKKEGNKLENLNNEIPIITKACPNCKVQIEKVGGCNTIVCKSCLYSFCWICLESLIDCRILGHTSNSPPRNSQVRFEIIKRYKHYKLCYLEHMELLEDANRWFLKYDEDIKLKNLNQIEYQFVTKGLTELSFCLKTLMYSYVFAYYLKNNNHSTIFELNQKNLKTAAKKLSNLMFVNEITLENSSEIQDMCKYCQKRSVDLINYVKEGYINEWWEFETY